ncbi:hypothetical protein MKEN_00294300 [Mycena kentingensis (nom. inval.)]|nr:hypothetical protein MKEN_00294300 [Mycena kentingensis (nom. inval.)]
MPRAPPNRASRKRNTAASTSDSEFSDASPPPPTPQSSPRKRAPAKKPPKKPTKSTKSKATATANPEPLSSASLLQNSKETTEQWYKSKRTKSGYANYVKNGKQWLEEWTAEGRLEGGVSVQAFEEMTEETPVALRALTAFKCEHLGRGFATAEGIRSAFKDYFERVCVCIVERSGVLRGRNGRFTTHCFRRGGAQYRFLWADRKWSLKAVGTLMRYLLDELMAYEEGFSDIMLDDRRLDRHETFMGENASAPVTHSDLTRFQEQIIGSMRTMIVSVAASTPTGGESIFAAPAPPPFPSAPFFSGQSAEPQPHPAPPPKPRPGRIPTTRSLDDALRFWEAGSPQNGLDTPLKDWDSLFSPAEYAAEAVKLGNIRSVCNEFRVEYGGDYDRFEAAFPGLRGPRRSQEET